MMNINTILKNLLKTPYSFKFNLRENKDVKSQIQNTALLSYLLYENGNIVVDEITPKERLNVQQYSSNSL